MHLRIEKAKATLFVVTGVVLGGCGPETDLLPQRSVESVADAYLAAMLHRYPATGTYYSIPGARHDELFDNSPAALADWQQREDEWLAELEAIGRPTEVGSRDWLTYGMLYSELTSSRATRICRSELWSASSATAWHTGMPFIFDIQPLETAELRAQALARLGKVAGYIATEISNLKRGLQLGFSAPRPTVVTVPAEIRALLQADNPFLNMAGRIDDDEFGDGVQRIFAEQIAPAIERYAAFIESEYLPQARETIALSENPDGASCYPALVGSFATVNKPAEEIHALGLEQVAGIRREMQAIIEEHFGGSNVSDFLRQLNNDPRYTFVSQDAVLEHARDALNAVRDRMPEAFNLLPKADVVIKPYPAYRASGTGEYHSSSEDGTRPGVFYLPVVDPRHRSRAGQQSFLFHETLPGHHLQGAIALELGDKVHPLARYLWNSGYGEGWALYAERLADEMGLYSGPLDRMGMLSDQSARAVRLVIDTGLHTKGWTRQQAVDYMLANTAWSAVDVESEINRYIAWPGQAVSYMLGMLEIRRLRSRAEERLVGEFDIREFHDRVLENGSVTLSMLDDVVNAWIDGASRAAK